MRKAGFYWEERILDAWRPRRGPDRPATVAAAAGSRLRRTETTGPPIRGIVAIPDGYGRLTLAQLREVLSVDGRFRWSTGIDPDSTGDPGKMAEKRASPESASGGPESGPRP